MPIEIMRHTTLEIKKRKTFFFFVFPSIYTIFAINMNPEEASKVKLSENIIIADADYVDYVAFQLSVQFERMIGRRIPKADLSQWAVAMALDGGLRNDGKPHETQVVLVHEKQKRQMENFIPSIYDTELSAQAFNDENLGEFRVDSFATNDVFRKDDYILDTINMMLSHEEVKRIMIVPNGEQGTIYEEIASALRNADESKRITMFAMQPMSGGNFRQEMLGYSVMSALGIKGDEIGK